MIQPKIVVRNTISGRRPPAPGRREKQEGIQGGGKLTPLQTTGCRLAHVRQAVHQGGGETPTPQGGGKLTPLPTTGYHLARVSLGGYATFYVSTQSFDDRDKPPAVSRGVSLPPPWGWVPPPPCGVPWGQGVAYSEN